MHDLFSASYAGVCFDFTLFEGQWTGCDHPWMLRVIFPARINSGRCAKRKNWSATAVWRMTLLLVNWTVFRNTFLLADVAAFAQHVD